VGGQQPRQFTTGIAGNVNNRRRYHWKSSWIINLPWREMKWRA
jgi:hypothetical protein